ncbi:heme o synthase [Portibacter lacus]|uniref:Protoheme IX farnesyltransferase n=1 Tax=Portibacter lacus TaxID=1099794 RepID=A0AA37ST61_9BACT|nr:heme o synthase [Portibacter lacus]GLR19702.1 protoheme IX farnesyltransferase [Portibacter lacus]
MTQVKTTYNSFSLGGKIVDYGLLIKFKLSLTVVFSAVMAYLILGGRSWIGAFGLFIGGMLVTGAANALNQVLEKDFDRLMDRTKDRPVVMGRITSPEAVLAAGLMSLVGITILGMFNPLTAFLGMLSLVLYAFLYTPLKRFSPVSVWIGTLPGALPILIGGAAIEGHISTLALIIFGIQVLWQLPHFWAIGWIGFEDYQKAGFKLLPVKDQSLDPKIGLYSFFAALPLIALGMLPFYLGEMGMIPSIIVAFSGILYAGVAWKFYKMADRKSALRLMFSSFIYLPVILFSYYIGSII